MIDQQLKQTLINAIEQLDQTNIVGFVLSQDSNSAPRFNMRFNRIALDDWDNSVAFLVIYDEDDSKQGYWGQLSPFNVAGGGWYLYQHIVFPLNEIVDINYTDDGYDRRAIELILSSGELYTLAFTNSREEAINEDIALSI